MRIAKLAATKFCRKLGLLLAIALVAVLVLDPVTAGCARVKIEISAIVTLIDDADNLLNNRVAPGDIITGIYTYDYWNVTSAVRRRYSSGEPKRAESDQSRVSASDSDFRALTV